MGIFERESGMLQGGVAGNGRGRPRGFTDSANGSTETGVDGVEVEKRKVEWKRR